jgi:vacuolar-type H+-ATPase subunit B/Vma2
LLWQKPDHAWEAAPPYRTRTSTAASARTGPGLGVYPPVDALASLSRLMRSGAGPGKTRDDHLDLAAQLPAALARARQVRDLADLVGEAALSQTDRRYLAFEERFRTELLDQGGSESRNLSDSLPSTGRGAPS